VSSASSRAPSSSLETYGPSFIQFLDDILDKITNSNLAANSSHEPTPKPAKNVPDLLPMASSNPTTLPLCLEIFIDDPFPVVRFQVPTSMPFQISFPIHTGPPFVRVHLPFNLTDQFQVRARLHHFPLQPSEAPFGYMFSASLRVLFIYIEPCNFTHPHSENALGNQGSSSATDLPRYQPPNSADILQNPNLAPQPPTPHDAEPTPCAPVRTLRRRQPPVQLEQLNKPLLNPCPPALAATFIYEYPGLA